MAPNKKKEIRRRAQNLARRLEGNEQLLERLEAVIDVAESDGPCSLDEIESALIEEMRKLGAQSLGSWVARREEALGKQVRAEHDKVREREKKTSISTRPSAKSR